MERTTLTRILLSPLTGAKWVAAATGKDRRQHLLQLTAAGRRKLVRSLPLWEEAQRQFLSQIGSESQEEIDLAARIKKGDRAARALMIKANLRLVVKIAHDYANLGLPLLD